MDLEARADIHFRNLLASLRTLLKNLNRTTNYSESMLFLKRRYFHILSHLTFFLQFSAINHFFL